MNCIIIGNVSPDSGGGVGCLGSSPSFTNCTISDNSAARGDGVYCASSSPSFENCTISGGGVHCVESSPAFTNCAIVENSGPAVYCSYSSPNFCSTVIAFSSVGMHFWNSATGRIEYCDFFDNSGGDITFRNNDPSQGPLGIGELVAKNENGDSCDVYFNIFCDPMFADTMNDDYHLTASSCCIDAGNPCQLDPDMTISDIGAYYFPHSWPDYDTFKEIYLCYALEETGRYVSWRPFANASGYKLYRTMEVDLPLNEWELLDTTPPDVWDYLDTEAYDPTLRYFYQVAVLY